MFIGWGLERDRWWFGYIIPMGGSIWGVFLGRRKAMGRRVAHGRKIAMGRVLWVGRIMATMGMGGAIAMEMGRPMVS